MIGWGSCIGPGLRQRVRVSQNNMLLLGLIQMVMGVLIVGSSFSSFFLSNFPTAIHNTSPYWAGLSGLLCGAVGIIAWKHNSMFTTTFYALLSSLCIVLNLLGAILTSKISQNLAPIQNCPCFCCTSSNGCSAYFTHGSGSEGPNGAKGKGAVGGRNQTSVDMFYRKEQQESDQHLRYVKPLPASCEQEAETLRYLMIVLCIENCLACAIATLSTVISLLLIAKHKTPVRVPNVSSSSPGNEEATSRSNEVPAQHQRRHPRTRGTSGGWENGGGGSRYHLHHPQITCLSNNSTAFPNDHHSSRVLDTDPLVSLSSRGSSICPWVLWHSEMQALLPPPYLPPPYSTSDYPNGFPAPFVLLNGPVFEMSWETDSLPPPYSSCELGASSCRAASPEMSGTGAFGGRQLSSVTSDNNRASCSSVLSQHCANSQKVPSESKDFSWHDHTTLHGRLRPCKSLENIARSQQTTFRSTHYLYRYQPNIDRGNQQQPSIVLVYKHNRLKHQRRFGSDGALQRIGFWHQTSQSNRKFKSVATLSGFGIGSRLHNPNWVSHSSTSRGTSCNSLASRNPRRFNSVDSSARRQMPASTNSSLQSNDFLMQTETFINDSSRAIQTLSNQIASAGVSALEKLVNIKNQLTGSIRPSQATSCYSALVNERINEETWSQLLQEDSTREFTLSLDETFSADVEQGGGSHSVILGNEVPTLGNCEYIVELPPMAASSSSSSNNTSRHNSYDSVDVNLITGFRESGEEQVSQEEPCWVQAKRTNESPNIATDDSDDTLSRRSTDSENSDTEAKTKPSKDTDLLASHSVEQHNSGSRVVGRESCTTYDEDEILPPSRYDYPAFLTIPLDQNPRSLESEKEGLSSVCKSGQDDVVQCEVDTNANVLATMSGEFYSSSSSEDLTHCSTDIYSDVFNSNSDMRAHESAGISKSLNPQISPLSSNATATVSLQNAVPARNSRRSFATNSEYEPVSSNVSRRRQTINHKYRHRARLSSCPAASSMTARRKDSCDDSNSGRHSGPQGPDYEYHMSVVASREQEYIRKHRTRNCSLGSAFDFNQSRDFYNQHHVGNWNANNEEQDSKTASVYVSLLNIIEQSQNLIADLALRYEADLTDMSAKSLQEHAHNIRHPVLVANPAFITNETVPARNENSPSFPPFKVKESFV